MVLAARLLASVFGAAVLVAAPAPAVAQIDSLPTLRVRAPATLAAAATRLELTPTAPLGTAMTLAGLREPGLPIDVILSPEDSDLARGTAPWISGFANAAQSRVVLFPARVGAFPAQSIETLLQHEVAHILFARAAGGHPVPRWFNEGLALAAERPIGLSDPPRLAWTLVRHGKLSLFALERLFGDGRAANQRAYAVAGALVQDLLRIHGDDSAARVLALIGEGRAFEDAFLGRDRRTARCGRRPFLEPSAPLAPLGAVPDGTGVPVERNHAACPVRHRGPSQAASRAATGMGRGGGGRDSARGHGAPPGERPGRVGQFPMTCIEDAAARGSRHAGDGVRGRGQVVGPGCGGS